MMQGVKLPTHWRYRKRVVDESQGVHVHLPFNFKPRAYQKPFLNAMRRQENPKGVLRACLIWHRRTGKDKTCLNFTIPRMFERVGAYYHFFPTATMGRDVLWDGIDRDGFRFMDHFPREIVKRTNSTEMMVELINGSMWKIRGTDKREPIGINPVGCVFSEYSRQNPAAGWDLVRPILAENGGWAVFNFTPKGKTHAYRLSNMAKNNPDWFWEILKADQTDAITPEAIEAERQSGMSEEMIQQEFYCSFEVGAVGSYYGLTMTKLWALGQIGNVPHNIEAPVYTAWDIGISDSTAIWFFQLIGKEVHVIDYYENCGQGSAHYAEIVRSKPYNYAEYYFPPDVLRREYQLDGSIETILEIYRRMLERRDPVSGQALEQVKVVDPHRVQDGIEQVRILLQSERRVWIDAERCSAGIDALENYHKEYRDKKEDYADKPDHDWSSHGADAFRYMALAIRYHIRQGGLLIGHPQALALDAAGGDDEEIWASRSRLDYHRQRRYRL